MNKNNNKTIKNIALLILILFLGILLGWYIMKKTNTIQNQLPKSITYQFLEGSGYILYRDVKGIIQNIKEPDYNFFNKVRIYDGVGTYVLNNQVIEYINNNGETKILNIIGINDSVKRINLKKEFGAPDNLFILTETGKLYVASMDFSSSKFLSNEIESMDSITDMTIIRDFSYGNCNLLERIVVQKNSKTYEISKNYEIGIYQISNDELISMYNKKYLSIMTMPQCYSTNSRNISYTMECLINGNINYVTNDIEKSIIDKNTNKKIVADKVIYFDNSESSVYYVITNSNELYYLNSDDNYVSSCGKIKNISIDVIDNLDVSSIIIELENSQIIKLSQK